MLNISATKYRLLNRFFFSWKLRSMRKFGIQNHFCAIFGGWDIFKTKWDYWLDYSDKNSNYLCLDQNHLIKNLILFCKYLSPRKSHRNGFIFNIFVWISIFRRKKRFGNPILGCRDIKRTRSLIFFGTPCRVIVQLRFNLQGFRLWPKQNPIFPEVATPTIYLKSL